MKYRTTNEWDHFEFSEAYVSEIRRTNDSYQLVLDNVMINPENSKNRDIRQMRANELYVTICQAQLVRIVQEGYKVYNADSKLIKQYEDQEMEPERYGEIVTAVNDGESRIYAFNKSEQTYEIIVEAGDERTYVLYITGTGDTEEWNRFLSV